MGSEFGQFCRTLRKRRGLTQMQLAQQAALAVRTVVYWETGQREPRGEELSEALDVLKATREERDHAYLLLTSSRGIKLLRRQTRTSAGASRPSGVLPDFGDLLAALRMRRGWSRESLAAQMQVKVSTVAGWERTQHLPSDENIDRLCILLDGYPEERSALLERRLSLPDREKPSSLEVHAERVREFCSEADLQRSSLIDLHALAIKRQLWLATEAYERCNLLAARVETAHSAWLFYQGRQTEAGKCARRALKLAKPYFEECDFVPAALNLASCDAVHQKGLQYDEGIELLRRWLPGITRPEHLAPIYCDLAYYASAAGLHEGALTYLQHAKNTMMHLAPEPTLLVHYQVTLARAFANAGKLNQALDLFPAESHLTGSRKRFHDCIRAELYWKAKLRRGANNAVQALYTELSRFSSPLLQQHVDQLAKQL